MSLYVTLLFHQDRPAIQLYQPGARSRNRAIGGGDSNPAAKKPETETEKVADKGDDWADF